MKIMIVSPHPDDSDYGLGGILNKLKDGSHELIVLCNEKFDVIDVMQQEKISERKKEMIQASDYVNAKCEFFSVEDDIESIADIVRKYKPNIVFIPFYEDFNPIHRRVASLFKEVLFISQEDSKQYNGHMVNQLYYYETFSTKGFNPDMLIDVSQEFTNAKKMLRIHKQGLKTLPSLEYKFILQHQQRGFDSSVHYAEGLMIEKEYWYSWNNNTKFKLELLNDLCF